MVLLYQRHYSLHLPLLWFAWRLLGLLISNDSRLPPGNLLQVPSGGRRPHHLANLFYWWQPLALTQHIRSVQEKGMFAVLRIHFPLLVVRDHRQDLYSVFIASAYQCQVKRVAWYSFVQFKPLLLWSGFSCLLWVSHFESHSKEGDDWRLNKSSKSVNWPCIAET